MHIRTVLPSFVQVAKHLDKLQKNKEDAAVAKLKALMPHVGPVAREMALQECGWDTERALALLRKFALSNAQELSTIQKVVKSGRSGRFWVTCGLFQMGIMGLEVLGLLP